MFQEENQGTKKQCKNLRFGSTPHKKNKKNTKNHCKTEHILISINIRVKGPFYTFSLIMRWRHFLRTGVGANHSWEAERVQNVRKTL